MAEIIFDVNKIENLPDFLGDFDCNIKLVEKEMGVVITLSGSQLKISGDDEDVEKANTVIETLAAIQRKHEKLCEQNILYAITMAKDNIVISGDLFDSSYVCVTAKGKPIKAKTIGQKKYVDAIKKNTVTFGIGPAGTGKTYLAVALAVDSFRKNEYSKIILTRPAVEAGEKLGFLPGDLQNKVDPYLRPLYDALSDMLGAESYLKYLERGLIEVAPLAYMRGRTLDDAFIILDEAQNTTPEQMKMFLTRIGFNSKAVITGDVTQIDLPDGKRSGLKEAQKILDGIEDILFIMLTKSDVVRHPLVQKIINAYEKFDARKGKR